MEGRRDEEGRLFKLLYVIIYLYMTLVKYVYSRI